VRVKIIQETQLTRLNSEPVVSKRRMLVVSAPGQVNGGMPNRQDADLVLVGIVLLLVGRRLSPIFPPVQHLDGADGKEDPSCDPERIELYFQESIKGGFPATFATKRSKAQPARIAFFTTVFLSIFSNLCT